MQLLKNPLLWLGGLLAAAALFAWNAKAQADPWTGCYVGATASHNSAVVGAGGTDFLGSDGLGASGLVGCDTRLGTSGLVIGAWGEYGYRQFDWATVDIDAQGWAAGGRAGVVVGNSLLYGLAGWTQIEAEASAIGPGSLDLDGFVYGGGIETGLGGGWYGRAEYQRLELEPDDFAAIEANINSFRAGITYKFGGSDALVRDIEAVTSPASKPLK